MTAKTHTFHFRLLVIVASLLTVPACDTADDASVAAQQAAGTRVQAAPVGPLTDAVIPLRYRLELGIDPRQPTFSGTTEIDIRLKEAGDTIWLHGKNLTVSSAEIVQGSKTVTARYQQHLDSGVSSLSTAESLAAGDATIRIGYSAPFNTSSNALYSVTRDDDAYAATQFQPIAARQVFPSFDEPRFKVPFDITILAREGDTVVTTTPEVSRLQENGMIRHGFATTRPLPTYLLAFVVGPYDVEVYEDIPPNSVRDRPIPLRGIAARGQGTRMRFALSHTAGLVNLLEEYFDIPYPYRKLDLIATPAGFGGAMENVGAIIYDEWLLLLDENASINQRRAYFATHAHELAHMWFGDLVTPDWWTDIWLNESFATWMSYKVAQAYWPEGQFDRSLQKGALGAMANDSLASAREIREIVDHNDRITDSFDGITYQKGGGVLGMIERYAGEENFRQGIRHHLNRYADSVANAPQFMESLAQGAELSEIEPVFASFTSQPGIPVVGVEINCGEANSFSLSQTRYSPLGSSIKAETAGWQIPVCISAWTGDVVRESCHLLAETKQTYPIPGACPDFVFPNAGGSGYYRFAMDAAGWSLLIDNVERLSGGEALALLDSLDAGVRAGQVAGDDYVRGLAALASHEDWNVADSTADYLEEILDYFPRQDQKRLQPALGRLMASRFSDAQANGPEVLADSLLRFMLIIARDPELRQPYAQNAAAYIGYGRDRDTSVTRPGQLETTLSIGVQDLGEEFFDQLLQMAIDAQDPAFRAAAIGSLARVEDPMLVRRLQAAVEAGQFRGTETTRILSRQMIRTSTMLTYEWLKTKPAEILRLIPETFRSAVVPALGSGLCSMQLIREWEQTLKANSTLIPGYERSMRQVMERNQLCVAFREQAANQLHASLLTLTN